MPKKRRARSLQEPCVPGGRPGKPWQDHVFVPTGEQKRFGCYQFGCLSRGFHVACATCGWPRDEHPEEMQTPTPRVRRKQKTGKPLHDHPFVNSGVKKKYLCVEQGCPMAGYHIACATCGLPENVHTEAMQMHLPKHEHLIVVTLSDLLPSSNKVKEKSMAVKLFRDDHHLAIQTEAPNEEMFRAQFAKLLSSLIETNTYSEYWPSVLGPWLEQVVNICCAYRGYKVEGVEQRTLYTAGKVPTFDAEPVHQILDEAQMLFEALPPSNGTQPAR